MYRSRVAGQIKPFSSDEKAATLSVQLPTDTVYSVAFIGPQMSPASQYDTAVMGVCGVGFTMWVTFNMSYLMLLLNYAIQGSLLIYLQRIVQDSPGECTGHWNLRFACLSIFATFVFKDLVQSADMIHFMTLVKTTDLFQEIQAFY